MPSASWDADGDIYDLDIFDDWDVDGDELELTYTTDSTTLDALIDGDIVLFGYKADNVQGDDLGFYAPPQSIGCGCDL